MRGPYDTLERLAQHFEEHLPARQRAYEQAMGWEVGDLEPVALITPTRPVRVAVEHTPALILSVLTTSRAELVEYEPLGAVAVQTWELTYRVRTEVLIAATDVETVDRWKYAQLTCVREVLLLHRALPVADGDGPARVLPVFTEQYDETSPPGGDNRVAYAQALLDVDVAVTEQLAGQPGTPVTSLTLAAHPVAPDAPLSPPAWHPADGPPDP